MTEKQKKAKEKFLQMHNSAGGNTSGTTNNTSKVSTTPTVSASGKILSSKGVSTGAGANQNAGQATMTITRSRKKDDQKVNSFFTDALNYMQEASGSYQRMTWMDSMDAQKRETRNTVLKNYADRSAWVRSYLDDNKDDIDADRYQSLMDNLDKIDSALETVGKSYADMESYFSQFKSEDEYKQAMQQQKDYTDKLNYDTKAGAQEIAQLEETLKEYNSLSRLNLSGKWQERFDELFAEYGDAKGIKDLISQKKSYLTQAQRLQESARLGSVGDVESEYYDPSFAYWAGARDYKIPTREQLEKYDTMMDPGTWKVTDDGRLLDSYGNEIDHKNVDASGKIIHPAASGGGIARDKLGIFLAATEEDMAAASAVADPTRTSTWSGIITEGNHKNWSQLEPNEVNTYYYYLNKEGVAAAERYLESLQDTLNYREGTAKYNLMEGKTGREMLHGVEAGLDQFASGLRGVGNAIAGKDEDIPTTATQYASGMIREDLARVDEDDPQWLGKVRSGAYDVITTSSNMLPSILTSSLVGAINPVAGSAVGTGLLSASAGGNAYNEMINRGYDENQSRTYAALIGASEAGLQAILGGISQFGGGLMSKGIAKALGRVDNAFAKAAIQFGNSNVGRVLINAIEEGGEEYVQAIIEPWLQNVLLGEENEIDLLSDEALYSSLLGAITGGVFETGGVIAEAANKQAVRSDAGKAIMAAEGGVDALRDLAVDVGGADSKLSKQAEKVTDEQASGSGLGIVSAAIKNATNQKKVGKLYEAVNAEISQQNKADIASALKENGYSPSKAENIADALTASLNGQELNKFQLRVLESVKTDSKVDEVVSGVLSDPESGISKRNFNRDLYAIGVATGTGISPTKMAAETVVEDDTLEGRSKKYGEHAQAMMATYNSNQDVAKFDQAYQRAYEYGQVGAKREFVMNSKSVEYLTPQQRELAYEAGLAAHSTVAEASITDTITELNMDADSAATLLGSFETMKMTDTQVQEATIGLRKAYEFGTIGNGAELDTNHFTSQLTAEQRQLAYNAGLAVRNKNTASRKAAVEGAKSVSGKVSRKGGVYYRGKDMRIQSIDAFTEKAAGISDMQKTAIETMKYMSELTGTEFYVYESYVRDGKRYYINENGNEEANAPNGWFDKATGKIYIDLHAGATGRGTMLFTIAHELTHFIRKMSPEKFDILADIVINQSNLSGDVEMRINEKMRQAKKRGSPIDRDTAYEEVIADSMETILTSGRVMEMMTEIKQQDKTLWEKICDWFKDFVDYLKRVTAAYKNVDPDSYEGKTVAEIDSVIRELEQVFAEGLVDAGDNYKSTIEHADATFEAEVDKLFSERQQYNPIREKFAKIQLDSLSNHLGKLFPLSAEFVQAIRGDNTPVSNMVIVANNQKKPNGDSYYTAAKNAFKTVYGGKTSFAIKQLGITADADASFARESISKVGDNKEKQTILDLTPYFKQLIEESRLLAVERTLHNDNKKTSLLCYRLYNAYIREEVYADQSGKKQTRKVPHIVVFNVVQNLHDAKAHMVTDINDVAISNGHNSSKLKYAAHANGNIIINSIADVYDVVKQIDREKGGLRYSTDSELQYKFEYSKKEDGHLYQGRDPDSVSTRSLLANALESVAQHEVELKKLQEYKAKIADVEAREARLQEIYGMLYPGSADMPAQQKRELQQEAVKIRNAITIIDKQLFRLEATKPLQNVLNRERNRVRKEMREQVKKEVAETKETEKQRYERRKESHAMTEKRKQIRKTIRDLRRILNHGDKKRNVKEDMKDMVSKAIDSAEVLFTQTYTDEDIVRYGFEVQLNADEEKYFKEAQQIILDMDKVAPSNEVALEKLKNRLSYRMGKLRDALYRERNRMNEATVSQVLGDLADAYASLETSEYHYVKDAYHAEVYEYLKQLQTDMGGAKVRDMSMTQLEDLHKAYKMVLETIRNANKMFNEDLKQTRDELGNAVMREVQRAGGEHGSWSKLGIQANKFSWNNLKPIYAVERIGSETFSKIMSGLFEGQYKWAANMEKARDFRRAIAEKHKANTWDTTKTYTFTSTNGRELVLSLDQILSLYAYSKREAAHDHITGGGIVFGKNTEVTVNKHGIKVPMLRRSATTYSISDELLAEIISTLSDEQKLYVDEMQIYLSDTMGGLGNEVSMKLYGVKLFGEENYFPLRSAGQYMEKAREADLQKQQGHTSIVNSGFTHAVKPHAKNPIILDGFTDVWAEHVNDMAMYNGMVLPMEDFRKIYNYHTPFVDGSTSVTGVIENAYGAEATAYFDQLYQELNSGAISDPRESGMMKWVSKFKKAAVMASMSVVVQQPSAIGRAFSEIHPKYFIGENIGDTKRKQLWDEVKKYAPVAIIKEMGGFDTHTGAGAKDYLLSKEYSKGEIAKALLKDKDYRKETYDMVLGYLPAKADELTWIAIWQAVKREIKAQNKDLTGQELLRKAGERFSQVIEKTQVYDSILARSANMRAKTGLMAMMTAFMAEPTTTINMLEVAIRGKKNVKRVLFGIVVSIVLNNMLASVIYAMRDDEEDETFREKRWQAFISGMADDFNPITYYPFLKDVWSIFQGYSVERSDMSVITDLVTSLNKAQKVFDKDTSEMDEDALAAYNKERWDAMLTVADSTFSMLGFPLKNIRRDVESVYNTWVTTHNGLANQKTSLGNHIVDAYIGTIPFVRNKWNRSKSDLLYKAIMTGNGAYEARLRSEYDSEEQITAAIRKGLKDNDARVYEAALEQIDGHPEKRVKLQKEVIADGFLQDDVITATNSIISKLTPDEPAAEPKKKGFYNADDFLLFVVGGKTSYAKEAKQDIIATHKLNGKTEDEAAESFVSSAKTALKETFLADRLTAAAAEHALKTYCGMEADDAHTTVNKWRFFQNTNTEYSDKKDEFVNGSLSAEDLVDALIQVEGKTTEEANKTVMDYTRDAYENGHFDRSKSMQIMMSYGGLTRNDAESKLRYIDTKKQMPDTYVNTDWVDKYYEEIEESGIPIDVYVGYRDQIKGIENDKDANGNSIKYSAVKKIMNIINSLPISSAQKYTLAKSNGWKESTIQDYKQW